MLANAALVSLLATKVTAPEANAKLDRTHSQRPAEHGGRTGQPKQEGPALRQAVAAPPMGYVTPPISHGLDRDTARRCNELIKSHFPELGNLSLIPDRAKHDIFIDGVVVTKYCNQCRRLIKGVNAHYSTEHTGPKPGTRYQSRDTRYQPRGRMAPQGL